MRISGQFGMRNCSWKVGIIEKLFICQLFVCDFLCQTVPTPQDQNVLIPPYQNMSTLLVSNMYHGNIGTFLHIKLCIKSWYSSKSLWILMIFLAWLFWAQNVLIPSTYMLLWKLCLNLWNRMWLDPSLSLILSFKPLGLWKWKVLFSGDLMESYIRFWKAPNSQNSLCFNLSRFIQLQLQGGKMF